MLALVYQVWFDLVLFCFVCFLLRIPDHTVEFRFTLGLHFGTLLKPLGYLLAPFWPPRELFWSSLTPVGAKGEKVEKGSEPG